MGINILKKVLLITAIPLLFAASCRKDGTRPCERAAYIFAVTSEWSPQREVYNVGDTIFLNSSFSKTLVDLTGNYNVDYSNSVGVGGNITTSVMDTITHSIIDGLSNFEIIQIKGNISPIANIPNAGKNITYSEQANYIFNAGVVLKQKGLYQLAVTDLSSRGIVGKNCTNAGFGMTVTNTDKHLNLFQYALGYAPDALLQKSIYCFRVQ